MEALTRERDRLLQRSARMVGLASTTLALACLLIPGVLAPDILLATGTLLLVLLIVFALMGTSRSPLLTVGGIVCGLSALAVVQVPLDTPSAPGILTAVLVLGGGSLASFAFVLTGRWWRLVILTLTAAASITLAGIAADTPAQTVRLVAGCLLGWALMVFTAHWLEAGVTRAGRHMINIGRAHRAERRASETEAQRRQGARLLHDTVLATLTLLAHSGVGVAPESMRQQAADDARLLRQLRLGNDGQATPVVHTMEPVAETPLGTTLESVKQRFGRMGLEVQWHGTGHVLLPSETLDAFLLALSECLENVRRHAGVSDAHVTITEDDTTVRAMVTDQGVGFDLDSVGESHLGFKESIVGRLREVGGNARLFSAPGSGTTVVLEVPRA